MPKEIMAVVVDGNPTLTGTELTLRVGSASATAEVYHTVAVAGTLQATIASITGDRIVSTVAQNGFVGVAYERAAGTGDILFIFVDDTLVANAGITVPVQSGSVTTSLGDSGKTGFLSGIALGIAIAQ